MALSKVKQQVANQFAAVLESLDEKNALDQNILRAIHGLCKALVDASAAQGDDMEAAVEDDTEVETGDEVEVEGDDDVSFDEEETEGEGDDELELDGDEEVEAGDDEEVAADDDEVSFDEEGGDDEVSFDDEEEAAPAKPSRGKAAAAAPAPVEEEAVDYDGMKAQELYNHLIERGVDQPYAKKIATTTKKEGLVKLAKNIDKLKALWLKNPIFKKPVAVIEKFVTTKQGLDQPSYGRGRSNDDKKRGILAEALAVAMKKPA